MPHKARPTGTIFQPEVAADAILFAAEHNRREIMVGYTTVEATLGEKIIPGLLDHYLADAAWEGSMLPRTGRSRISRTISGSRCRAIMGRMGRLIGMAHRFSPQLWATKHRKYVMGYCWRRSGWARCCWAIAKRWQIGEDIDEIQTAQQNRGPARMGDDLRCRRMKSMADLKEFAEARTSDGGPFHWHRRFCRRDGRVVRFESDKPISRSKLPSKSKC